MKRISKFVRFVLDRLGSRAIKSGQGADNLVACIVSTRKGFARRAAESKPVNQVIVVELLYDDLAVAHRDRWSDDMLQLPKFIVFNKDTVDEALDIVQCLEVAQQENHGYPVIYGWNFAVLDKAPVIGGEYNSLARCIRASSNAWNAKITSPTSQEEKDAALIKKNRRLQAWKENNSA